MSWPHTAPTGACRRNRVCHTPKDSPSGKCRGYVNDDRPTPSLLTQEQCNPYTKQPATAYSSAQARDRLTSSHQGENFRRLGGHAIGWPEGFQTLPLSATPLHTPSKAILWLVLSSVCVHRASTIHSLKPCTLRFGSPHMCLVCGTHVTC